jgi:NAD(P)-dependent dehydrogenase (short-subunit alcohol dehydrogenase family)
MKFYITGTRRGLGKALAEIFPTVDTLEECDVFINCKHNGFEQVELLYKAAKLKKKIINIGSNSPDENKQAPHVYQVEKAALDKANHQLFYQGVDTSIVRFGYLDTERVAHIEALKIKLDYAVEIVMWVLQQPHRIKEITICPK